MAGQTQVEQRAGGVHVGMMPFSVMAYSLSEAICRIGVPTLEIGISAANSGLIKISDGEGTNHFEWDRAALDRHPPIFLENLLLALRQAAGVSHAG